MSESTRQQVAMRDWWSWLWLVFGAAFMVFVPAQTSHSLAAWLAPVFLLRFSRVQRAWVGLPAIGISIAAAMYVAFRNGFMPLDGPAFHLAIAGIGFAYVVVFALDKVLWERFTGLTSTLAFPLASTAVGFLATKGNPIGTGGSEAYSQTDPGLLQLVSVTGIWGIVFLMSWFAAVVNALWQQGFDPREVRRPLAVFFSILLVVLGFGGVRLALLAPTASTVRTAAVTPEPGLMRQTLGLDLDSERDRHAARLKLEPLVRDLFGRSAIEVKAGARVIVWSEGAARVLKEDEDAFLAKARQFARQHTVYLQLGLATLLDPSQRQKVENRAVLLTPTGSVAWDYEKSKTTPGDPERPGPGTIPTLETPYGTFATIICQDDLFPELVRQAGKQGVDILFVPSNDWVPVAEMHARVAAFRAVENGVSIVRPTSQGTSLATDPVGRLVAYRPDHLGAQDHTLVADVPVNSGTPTLHTRTGDSLAYLSIAGVAVLGGWALIRRRTRSVRATH